MSDKSFKNTKLLFPDGLEFVEKSNGSIIGFDKYKPDKSYADQSGQITLVIESTSTGDRKVGIGELLQAEKYFCDHNVSGTLIFSLSGSSNNSPRPNTQKQYLQPYFDFLKQQNSNIGVYEIYLILESDLRALDWYVMNDAFREKADRISKT
ncbi:hypothetical protein ABIE61_003354 [Marinobacterium sp. MBR-111]|jgi:hypothetical protein|uniref:hypothetical protein n=1 Tax=Marinobacterium sp. MBR-111 TaxID=3156463 RepID=UPI0033960015